MFYKWHFGVRSPRQATPYQPKQNRNVVKGESRKAEREKGVLARPLREPPFYTAIGLFSGLNAKFTNICSEFCLKRLTKVY